MKALLCWLLLLGAAHAAPSYEARHIADALAAQGYVEAAPSDAPLAFIEVVRFEVFRPGELIPTFINALHPTTRAAVVLREVRLRVGEPWQAALALEAERVLRRIGIFQLVRIISVRDAAGRPGALVLTRDLWSLRFEQGFQYTDGQFDSLTLQLTERNLLGRAKAVALNTTLTPLTLSFGESYVDRRIWLGRIRAEQRLTLYVVRDTGTYDGLDTEVTVSLPFHHLDQRWGFALPLRYFNPTTRQVRAGAVLTWDDPTTPETETVARIWDRRYMSAAAYGYYQRPGHWTQKLSLGLIYSQYDVSTNAETALPEANRAQFEATVLPRGLQQIYPRIRWSLFERRYRRLHDLRSFGVSEDLRLGPSVELALSAPLEALGSDVNALAFSGGLSWTTTWAGDGVLDLLLAAEGRLEACALIDRELLARLRWATPRLGWGRIVSRTDWLLRSRDTANRLLTLGGDNGLRGYSSQYFFAQGASRLRTNLEYRTPPWARSWLHLGGAAFYDAGEIYTATSTFKLRQAVGLGVRLLFPQFNREVYRFDFGVPVDGSAGVMLRFTAGSQQAVPLTPEEDRGFGSFVGGFENEP
jgi:hypothetical protein